MDINLNVLQDGLTVLCVGFSVVFVFLSVLIFAMGIMGKVVGYLNKIFPVVSPVATASKKAQSSDDTEIAIAIAAALMKA